MLKPPDLWPQQNRAVTRIITISAFGKGGNTISLNEIDISVNTPFSVALCL